MMVCPFISTNRGVTRCHPECALLMGEKCAFVVLAEAKLAEQKAKSTNNQADHK